MENGWIDPREQMPGKEVDVYVCFVPHHQRVNRWKISVGCWVGTFYDGKRGWLVDYDNQIIKSSRVLAWKPLDSPFKDE